MTELTPSRADLKGATALGISPYLPFIRFHPLASDSLPVELRSRTIGIVTSILQPLGIHPDVVSSMSELAVFALAVRQARQRQQLVENKVVFDPYEFAEEWLGIIRELLTRPNPLQSRDDKEERSDSAVLEGEKVITGHLERALRVAGLLFLRVLLSDWPRNLGGEGALLGMLQEGLQKVVGWVIIDDKRGDLGHLRRWSGSHKENDDCEKGAARPNSTWDLVEDFRQGEEERPGEKTHANLVPAIIFICLIGNHISLTTGAERRKVQSLQSLTDMKSERAPLQLDIDTTLGASQPNSRYSLRPRSIISCPTKIVTPPTFTPQHNTSNRGPGYQPTKDGSQKAQSMHSIFRASLRNILGLENQGNVDTCVTNEDLELAKLFGLGWLFDGACLGMEEKDIEQEQRPEKQKDKGGVDENEHLRTLLRRVVT